MRIFFFIIFFNFSFSSYTNNIHRTDIDNFWKTVDLLKNAENYSDSLKVIEDNYINKGTSQLQKFFIEKKILPSELLKSLKNKPLFWESIRRKTTNLDKYFYELDKLFESYSSKISNFKQPNIYFIIGPLRTGGTVINGEIVIATEMVIIDEEVVKSEIDSNLLSIVSGNILIDLISHEIVHTLQKGKLNSLSDFVINEGVADFISIKIIGSKNLNPSTYNYGYENDCYLKNKFIIACNNKSKSLKDWLFNRNSLLEIPPDIGYYIGFRIAEDYYLESTNKEEAIKNLLNRKTYKYIYKNSNYLFTKCNYDEG
ncbi:hypothetical protein EQG68_02370 [Flavobacterium piscinae]|uniref:DUF2268 domain-containing protein n=1 Tax=Flavobacterium piscinae TaxID=2506424 RepID=A0A4Q1KZH7_9FLAO|nr:DUF2268 domain-containing putative Zn-dependent protease [Flavobacterium piscinae]RXR34774.1 hypothetical protein EQG68_02370 [Flavobacterium piscinae]